MGGGAVLVLVLVVVFVSVLVYSARQVVLRGREGGGLLRVDVVDIFLLSAVSEILDSMMCVAIGWLYSPSA